jgi:hypothetical protein
VLTAQFDVTSTSPMGDGRLHGWMIFAGEVIV